MNETSKKYAKPPPGLLPKKFHDEQTTAKRLEDVQGAIARYLEAGLKINTDWIEEYNELVDQLDKKNNQQMDLLQASARIMSNSLYGAHGIPPTEETQRNLMALQEIFTGYFDDADNPIFVNDILKNQWGYKVTVAKDNDGHYYGKLVCNDEHPCKNIPYALNQGKGHIKVYRTYKT